MGGAGLGRSTSDRGLVRRARVAVSVVFCVHGAVMGSFAARVPWVADRVGVDVGGLGVALLMPGVGAVSATLLSGRLVHRFEQRALIRILLPLWCLALLLPAFPASLAPLCLSLVAYGAAGGFADVAMNSQGVLVEQRLGRSVMSGMHGCWSAGVLLGSGVAALAELVDLDARVHFCLAGVVLAVVAIVASGALLPHRAGPEVDAPPAFALPSRAVLPVGLIALCAVFGEGACQDWSAVFVHDRLGQPASTAALAVSTFSLSMAGARFAGDWAVRRPSPPLDGWGIIRGTASPRSPALPTARGCWYRGSSVGLRGCRRWRSRSVW